MRIGLSTTFDPVGTGTYFVMRAKKGSVDPTKLRLDRDQRLVDSSGNPVGNFPYMVFSIDASDRRDDWFLVPGLSDAYGGLNEAVKKGRIPDAQEAFGVFKRAALTSPDLLRGDARRLVDKVEGEMEEVLQAALTSSVSASLPELKEIDLYQ